MSGRSIQTPETAGPASWEKAGRFFLDECISVRQSYDFLEHLSLLAVITSFWLSTSFFEISQSRKSWYYLREALTLALEMGLQDDSTYTRLGPKEKLCRQRVFWQLFVTERSFAVLRNKPITLKKTPSLPTTRHPYEAPEIHSGLMQLISSYYPLDESFMTAWNDSSDPGGSSTTYLALQHHLSTQPAFMSRSGPAPSASSTTDPRIPSLPSTDASSSSSSSSQPAGLSLPNTSERGTEIPAPDDGPEPTAIQKADLLITQQWLRLIIWQSSFRQSLLSWAAPHASMHFAFPLVIARRTAAVLQSLPERAVEVHGMGIFEKIFEIGTWSINVLGAYDDAAAAGTRINGGLSRWLGMDFVSGDMDVLGTGRKGALIDPLEFFVRTLSASPNSRTQYAEKLMLFAGERPGGMKMALSPPLHPMSPRSPSRPGPPETVDEMALWATRDGKEEAGRRESVMSADSMANSAPAPTTHHTLRHRLPEFEHLQASSEHPVARPPDPLDSMYDEETRRALTSPSVRMPQRQWSWSEFSHDGSVVSADLAGEPYSFAGHLDGQTFGNMDHVHGAMENVPWRNWNA